MPTKTVLFIDDEPHSSQYYLQKLEGRGYTVVYRSSAETGLRYLEERAAEVDVLVLDMMMPTPLGVTSGETEEGQTTGVWLLVQVRQTIEDGKIPVVVLTNSKRVALEAYIRDQVAPLNWRLLVKTKTEVTARELPVLIDEIFG